jgi:hypothetical protein
MHDVHVRAVIAAGAIVATGVGSAVLAAVLLLHHWSLPAQVDTARPLPARWPAPALQSAPQLDLERYRADKEALLRRTEPVAGEPGVARIPIDTAMALMARRAASAPPEGKR